MKKEKTLTANQAKFVKLVVEKGYSYVKAYVEAYNSEETDKVRLKNSAQRVVAKAHVREAIERQKAQVNMGVAVWNKEKAVSKLMKLLNKAEEDLEIKGLTKVNTDTVINTIKELNAMVGLNFKDQKKYEVDIANLEISRLRYELDKTKVEGPDDDDREDDGFMDAIKAEVGKIWSEE